jgi:CheY-like chemotaxis protein
MLLEDYETLAKAKLHSVIIGKLVSPDVMLSYIDGYELTEQLLENPTTSQGKIVKASFQFGSEFNFILGHPLSVGVALDKLVSDEVVPQEFADALISYANPITYPFVNKTEQDFQIAKGTIQRKPVTVSQGFCTITTSENCEKHNPQVYRRVTFSEGDYEYVRVAGFTGVSSSKKYRIQCPSFPDMWIDNAYDVIS